MSTKRKFNTKLGQPMVKPSAKPVGKTYVDESRTVASSGHTGRANGFKKGEVVELSSDSSSDSDASDHDAGDDAVDADSAAGDEDVAMADAEGAAAVEDTEEAAEPSFGDLVRANASEPIDVAGAFEDAGAVSFPQGVQLQTPSGASLGTVLSQALKTNDVALLESCLQTSDNKTIRATIQRLDSPLAGTLLQKLAERIHRRPGRSGSLMNWVQWSLVTHGGYLATQPDLIQKLAELNKVLDERSKSINNLLSLKGKLDMLEAQIDLRKSMQRAQQGLGDEEDDEDVIYVEGQESDDEQVAINGIAQKLGRNGELEELSEVESEDSEDMPMVDGMVADSEDEDEDSDEDDLIDDEAIETDAESGDEDEVDHDDMDSQGDISESDDGAAAPPTKMQRIGGKFARGKK
ncbi:hypothetical protein PVAG01_00659 [Phlyctema vagabunda]|uniref:Small-subunit processome Utp12 domain-containing protein n=1 Tax=Phlyctema vagabunda TaxID=108571 RepID=A0ABR4PUV7_9HELO